VTGALVAALVVLFLAVIVTGDGVGVGVLAGCAGVVLRGVLLRANWRLFVATC
jgi:hypothetical protein